MAYRVALRYLGKLCAKHPELKGERRMANRKCVRCASEKMIAWAKKNKEKMRAHNRACYERNKLKRIAYRRANADKTRLWRKQYHAKNPELAAKRAKAWRDKNRCLSMASVKNSWVRRYALIGSQALSKKYSKEINEIYCLCPDGHEVDHIVPLRGVSVSGLHVPWNLQYLASKENRKKGNKWLT